MKRLKEYTSFVLALVFLVIAVFLAYDNIQLRRIVNSSVSKEQLVKYEVPNPARFELRKENTGSSEGNDPNQRFSSTSITEEQINRAAVIPFDDGSYGVKIFLNDDGTKKFKKLTADYLNRSIAIFIDDVIISAPVIKSVIESGELIITGNFTEEEATNLQLRLLGSYYIYFGN